MRMRNPKDKEEILKKCDFYYLKDNGFLNNNPIEMEIGMGKGDFLIGMAQKFPNINFIGVEKYSSVASVAIKKILPLNLTNLKVIICDAVELPNILGCKISKIYLNFSDPWPKKRHELRRLTSEKYLNVYDNLFNGKKIIEMKTDNEDLFKYSLESLTRYGYLLNFVTFDLHNTNIFNVETEYEKKFKELGINIKKVIAFKDC